jgi:hypothetical protein
LDASQRTPHPSWTHCEPSEMLLDESWLDERGAPARDMARRWCGVAAGGERDPSRDDLRKVVYRIARRDEKRKGREGKETQDKDGER